MSGRAAGRDAGARGCCPTCGQALPGSLLKVDLDSGWAIAGDWKRHLSPQEAELLFALLERPGATMKSAHLISRVWGIAGPADSKMNLGKIVQRLRENLRGSGHEIRNTYAYGFAVRRIDA